MGFSCGIVGLPNVGKSTLFNALTATIAAEAANYPFCTIEPNKGVVAVPDERLFELAKLANSKKIIPTQIEIHDIAGLVKGASNGEGLGNQFLSHIREVDAIIHVLRCFIDDDITHVEGSVSPIRDLEIIESELILADLESVTKRIESLDKKIRGGKKEYKVELELLQKVSVRLNELKFASTLCGDGISKEDLNSLQLLTTKPILYVCNVSEDDAAEGNHFTKKVEEYAHEKGANIVIISSKIEQEIAALDSENEKKEFLETLGLAETGLSKIIKKGYKLLDLVTFFTVGPKEAHAWTLRKGLLAPQAAGVIHTDFEKGFIRAEVIAYEDFIRFGSETAVKESGKMRVEGKDYILNDGDIVHFRFNV